MTTVALAIMLLAQGIPVLPGQGGTVTGILRTKDGKPAVGVRVGAMVRPDSALEVRSSAAMAGLAETDEAGRFRLENIPPGRYYIAAGRVDFPTYFPGTQDMAQATSITISPGDQITGLDFVFNGASTRPTDLFSQLFGGLILNSASVPLPRTLPVEVTVEAGKIPVFANGKFPVLRIQAATGQNTAPLSTSSVTLSNAASNYEVTIEDLPDNYFVKSMRYDSAEVANRILKIPAAISSSPSTTISAATPLATVTWSSQIQAAFVQGGGTTPLPLPKLSIVLGVKSPPRPIGVWVAGYAASAGARAVYISGRPGVLYSDGTFEFDGVPPGPHSIVLAETSWSRPLGASIVVGDKNVDGVQLEKLTVLPLDASPADARITRSPGTVIPLASVRGRILEETSHEPIDNGAITINGHSLGDYGVDHEGRFEIPRLLPGAYDVKVSIFGHSTIVQTVVVGDEDVTLEWNTRRLY